LKGRGKQRRKFTQQPSWLEGNWFGELQLWGKYDAIIWCDLKSGSPWKKRNSGRLWKRDMYAPSSSVEKARGVHVFAT